MDPNARLRSLLSRPRSLARPPSGYARAAATALCLLAATAAACGNKTAPTPQKEPPAPTAQPSEQPATAMVAPGPSAVAEEPPAAVPELVVEKFRPDGIRVSTVHAVEGALMVVNDNRVGRIVDDESVEWVKKTIARERPGIGENRIESVTGRWPNEIGVVYSSSNGRAPMPTYFPLTGVGEAYTAAAGGGLGYIYGAARLGESYVLAAYGLGAVEFTTVRGTASRKPQKAEDAGCKEEEMKYLWGGGEAPALPPQVIESSTEGTLMSIGRLCDQRGAAAEIWDKTGKSRIVDLTRFWKKMASWPLILKGKGDELWAYSDLFTSILHYRKGEFAAVPDLERPVKNVFTSPSGDLLANDGKTIHRYRDGKWSPVGRLANPERYYTMAMDEKETIWVSSGEVSRLRPEPRTKAPPDECSTPFVYLYEVSSKNEKNFSYPSTRKALSTFAEVDAIGLVEFDEAYRKRLGITVQSKAQGEAVVAHIKETMKDEAPKLICFAPTTDVRKIDMKAKK